MNRLLDDPAGWHIDKSAVLKKGGVEGRKRIVRTLDLRPQVHLDQLGIVDEGGGEILDDNALLGGRGAGQFGDVMAVNENQATGGQLTQCTTGNDLRGKAISRALEDRIERPFGDWGDVSEAPILLPERWETQFGKARDAGFATRKEPGRLFGLLLEPLELLQIRVGFFHSRIDCHHDHSAFCLKCLSNGVW
jgi:hypothetical protein